MFYEKGQCERGSRCAFAHGPMDLRKPVPGGGSEAGNQCLNQHSTYPGQSVEKLREVRDVSKAAVVAALRSYVQEPKGKSWFEMHMSKKGWDGYKPSNIPWRVLQRFIDTL